MDSKIDSGMDAAVDRKVTSREWTLLPAKTLQKGQ